MITLPHNVKLMAVGVGSYIGSLLVYTIVDMVAGPEVAVGVLSAALTVAVLAFAREVRLE